MWRIPRSTDSYIVWVYRLWLFLLEYLLQMEATKASIIKYSVGDILILSYRL